MPVTSCHMVEPALEPDAAESKHTLVQSPNKQEIMDLSLLLASQGMKHWMEFDGQEFNLAVEETDANTAHELIKVYRTENLGYQVSPVAELNLELYFAPLLFLSIPILSYFTVESQPWANWWHSRGSADAKAILAGEWWRCLTATTLHADDLHFMSNLVSGYFILNLLNHRLGMGTIMVLSSLGGALANLLVAMSSGPGHVSIGFSSVVFCSFGLLGAVETLFLPAHSDRNLRRLTPMISALFVAVLVGLGENVDVKAHFYALGIGAAMGILTRFIPKQLARPAWQVGQILVAYALYALTWALATQGSFFHL